MIVIYYPIGSGGSSSLVDNDDDDDDDNLNEPVQWKPVKSANDLEATQAGNGLEWGRFW